jgi:hypothetical protein
MKNMFNSISKLIRWFVTAALILTLNGETLTSQTFSGHILGGANFSQIRGDGLSGMKRMGLHGGIGLTVEAGNNSEVGLELTYNQRGSVGSFSPFDQDNQDGIVLQYADIPVYIAFKDWKYTDSEGSEHHRMRFLAGLSVGRLLKSEISGDFSDNEEETEMLTEAFSSTDFSWLIGAGIFVNPSLQFQVRYTRSINPLFDSKKNSDIRADTLLGSFITARISWHF